MSEIDVVVTGIGLVTPLGMGREKTWQALLGSRSAIVADNENIPHLCARVDTLPVPDQLRLLSLSFLAAGEAIQDSGVDFSLIHPERFGCTVSVSKPNLAALSQDSACLT